MFSRYFTGFLSLVSATVLSSFTVPAVFLSFPQPKASANERFVSQSIDWSRITFSTLPPVTEGGTIYGTQYAGGLGYDPSRSWEAGTPIAEIVKLGDLSDTAIPSFKLGEILSVAGYDPSSVTLSALPLLENLNVRQLVRAVPGLSHTPLQEVPVLHDLAQLAVGRNIRSLARKTVGELLNEPKFANLSLANVDLSGYSLADIPGLVRTPLKNLPHWANLFVWQILGLADLPLNQIFALDSTVPMAMVDVVFGEKEARRLNTITGGYEEGFNVSCDQSSCAYLELVDVPGLPPTGMHGKQWVSGYSQEVKGGSGCLAWVNGGKEPTGRHPFGSAFKLVLTDTDEPTATAEFSLYFRFSTWCGKSPYFIGPVPLFSIREKDLIFVGY